MHVRSRRRRPRDVTQLAKSIVDEATATSPTGEPVESEPPIDPIRQAAAEMGRRGGLKGGPARAKKLSAKKAVKVRWTKKG